MKSEYKQPSRQPCSCVEVLLEYDSMNNVGARDGAVVGLGTGPRTTGLAVGVAEGARVEG